MKERKIFRLIGLDKGEGRARRLRSSRQPRDRAARQRRLPGAERARQRDDIARAKRPGDRCAKSRGR